MARLDSITRSERRPIWIVGALALLLAGAWLVSYLFQALLVIFAGLLLGVFLAKLTARVSSATGLRYGVAYGLVVAALAALLGGSFYFMGNRIANQVGQLADALTHASNDLTVRLEQQEWWRPLSQFNRERSWLASEAVATARVATLTTLSVAVTTALMMFLGLYFALQPERYRNGFMSLFDKTARTRVRHVLDTMGSRLWRWMLGRLVGMIVIGVGSTAGLWLLGVPLPATLGALAGLLNFIPNFGPFLAGIPAVLLALQQGTSVAFYVLLFYFGLQFLESYLLTPYIDQHQVSLPPGLTLSAQLLFGALAGVLGLLLATPLTVVLVTLVQELHVQDRK
jgi:predicted PurR-regulated permease PerM